MPRPAQFPISTTCDSLPPVHRVPLLLARNQVFSSSALPYPHLPQFPPPWALLASASASTDHGATSLTNGALPRQPRQSPSKDRDSLDSTPARLTICAWQRAILLANCLGYAKGPLNRPLPSQRTLLAPVKSRAAVKKVYTCTRRGTLVDRDSHPGETGQHANRYSRTVGSRRFGHRIGTSCCRCYWRKPSSISHSAYDSLSSHASPPEISFNC